MKTRSIQTSKVAKLFLGNKEAQVTAARFYLENPKDMDSIIQEVEKLSLENQGFQVEKENRLLNKSRIQFRPSKPSYRFSSMAL